MAAIELRQALTEPTTLAIAVLQDRIRTLPAADREDLYQLTKAMFRAESEEESLAVARGIQEIFDQQQGHVHKVTPEEPSQELQDWMNFVGGHIRQNREKRGLTQAELARKTGLPQSHISRLENCKHSPSFSTIEKIALALEIDPSELDRPHERSSRFSGWQR